MLLAGAWIPRQKAGLYGLMVLLLGLLVAGTGCDRELDQGRDENGAETAKGAHEVSYAAVAAGEVDVSSGPEVATEENALKAYFKGKKLLSMAYFAKDEARARQYSAEAERWFEKSLRFYVPDIEAMVAGKSPVHASANWEFLKGLHEAWSDSIKLSGKRLTSKEYIDKNAKDAWALSVISRMIQNEVNEEKRRELIAGKFSEIREGLASSDKYAEQVAGKRGVSEKKRSKAAQTRAAAEPGKDREGKPSAPTSPVTTRAKASVAASKAGLDKGLVAEDSLAGKTAFLIKPASNQTEVTANAVKSAASAGRGIQMAATAPSPGKRSDGPSAYRQDMSGGIAAKEAGKARDALIPFRPVSPPPAKIYVGDRVHTLTASPGKLYIGDRVHTLQPHDKAQPWAQR
ncbi:MAG: hypothetical protein HZC54_11450 [Verrucomicrobia bacterium]|nr:hypothetical protein [Verrucomicrobiota bacterium]